MRRDKWTKKAQSAGQQMADRLTMRGYSAHATNCALEAFAGNMKNVFVQFKAPDPERLANVAVTTARETLRSRQLH
jgi:hypothetical protein